MNWIQGIGRIFIQDIHEAIAESVPVAIAIRVLLDAFADRIAVFNDCIGHSLLIGIWPAGFRIYFVDIAEGRQRIGYFDAPLGHCAGKMVHFRYLRLPETHNQIVQVLLSIGGGGLIVIIHSFLEVPGLQKLRADFQ